MNLERARELVKVERQIERIEKRLAVLRTHRQDILRTLVAEEPEGQS